MSKIGRNIKKIRAIKGLSQHKFAKLFDLSRGNISSYEELRAEPKIETVVNIAKYFSIPLNDFILKDLSVNELVNFDSSLVIDSNQIKKLNKIIDIPYITHSLMDEYVTNYQNLEFINELPKISIPSNSKFKLIAFEIDNSEDFPNGFSYKNGDIIIFEIIEKENVHRILNKLGIMINLEGIKTGIFTKDENEISLTLNEFVKYSFNLGFESHQYWMLRGHYSNDF